MSSTVLITIVADIDPRVLSRKSGFGSSRSPVSKAHSKSSRYSRARSSAASLKLEVAATANADGLETQLEFHDA